MDSTTTTTKIDESGLDVLGGVRMKSETNIDIISSLIYIMVPGNLQHMKQHTLLVKVVGKDDWE